MAAILAHEAGALYEHLVCDPPNATRCYRKAFKLDPSFTPPLLALQRIYSDAFDYGRVAQILEARHLVANSPVLRAALLTEHALVISDHIGDPARAEALLEAALDADPNCQPAALMLQLQALSRGESDGATLALEYQSNQASDTALRGALLRELAQCQLAKGADTEARALLRSASRLNHGRYSALSALHDHALSTTAHAALVPDSQTSRDMEYALAWKLDSCLRFAHGEDRAVELDNAPLGRFLTREQAATQAGVLAWESAAHHSHINRNAEAARSALAQAVHVLPATSDNGSRLAVIEQYATCCWHTQDFEGFEQASELQLILSAPGPDRTRFEYHHAESALAQNRLSEGILRLRAALDGDPKNPVIAAHLEQALLQSGDYLELCEERLRRADAGGPDAPQLFFQAAFIAARMLRDGPKAAALCDLIEPKDSAWALEGQRLLFVEASAQDWPALALASAIHLGRSSADISERSFFVRYGYGLKRNAVAESNSPAAPLEPELLHNPDAAAWAPHAARVQAAEAQDGRRLADAHQLLASLPGALPQRSAHLSAAARALLNNTSRTHLMAGPPDHDRAISLLESALTAEPDNAYAIALLNHLLQQRGDGLQAMALLQKDAQFHSDRKRAAHRLVASGVVALTSGHPEFATERFREALSSDPSRHDAWFGLWEAALTTNLNDELAHATAGLGQLNLLDDTALELAELTLEAKTSSASAEYAERAIEDSAPGFSAAIMALAHHRDTPAHAAAIRLLERHSPEHCWRPHPLSSPTDTLRAPASPLSQVFQAVAGVSRQLSFSVRAQAWATLAHHCDARKAPEAHAELMLQGIYCHLLSGQRHAGVQALEMALALGKHFPESPATLSAQRATIGPAEAPNLREHFLQNTVLYTEFESRSVRNQWIHALLELGNVDEALKQAQTLASHHPSSPSCLELWRHVAHLREAHADVVAANDKLGQQCAPDQSLELLLESAHLLRHKLDDAAGAEQRLHTALANQPDSLEAFDLLHDMLIDRDAPKPLLECIETFLERPRTPTLEIGLRYESAQISAALDDRPSALRTLLLLLRLNPRHVGALSLLARTYVGLEEYRNAVIALTRLSETDIPDRQRRLARLGATDYLLGSLEDPAGARSQLEALQESELAEPSDLAQLAQLYAKNNQFDLAVKTYEEAARHDSDGHACRWLKEVGRLHDKRPGFDKQAVVAYRKALEATPTDSSAHRALHQRLESSTQRAQEVARFLNSIQHKLSSHPTQPKLLRALRVAGSHGAMPLTEFAALDALRELGEADHAEQTAHQLLRQQLPSTETTALTDDEVRMLQGEEFDGKYATFAELCAAAVENTIPSQLRKLNLKRRHRTANTDKRVAISPALNRFGLTLRHLYLSDELNLRPILMQANSPNEVDCVLPGDRDEYDEQQLRFELGFQALAQRLRCLPLLRLGPMARRAALIGAVPSAPQAESNEEVKNANRRLYAHTSRRIRKELVQAAPDPAHAQTSAETFLRELETCLVRGGLLTSGVLGPALRLTNAGTPVGTLSKQSISLYRFWLSPQARALRGEGPNMGDRTEEGS